MSLRRLLFAESTTTPPIERVLRAPTRYPLLTTSSLTFSVTSIDLKPFELHRPPQDNPRLCHRVPIQSARLRVSLD